MKTEYEVKYGEDYIQIIRLKDKKEICYWDIKEWEENPKVVFSICNAIQLAECNKIEEVLEKVM